MKINRNLSYKCKVSCISNYFKIKNKTEKKSLIHFEFVLLGRYISIKGTPLWLGFHFCLFLSLTNTVIWEHNFLLKNNLR